MAFAFTACLLITSIGCSLPSSNQSVHLITIEQLVADPKRYVGERVGVSGYFQMAYEECVLYQSRERRGKAGDRNIVWVYAARSKELNVELTANAGKDLTIFGVLSADPNGEGHLGWCRFGLNRVDGVEFARGSGVGR